MTKPDFMAVLEPLKAFQRRTVEHAYARLFDAPDSSGRFLVADEVGLGKTLVARGVIARTVERLWDRPERIDIVYICSNQSIARSNLPKLRISAGDETSFSSASRLTMLATELAPAVGRSGLAQSKLNFISFTPGTSFNMGLSNGKEDERRVLFHLLDGLVEPRVGLMNLLQGQVRNRDRWRKQLLETPLPLEEEIAKSFRRRFESSKKLQTDVTVAVAGDFSRYKEHYSGDSLSERRRLIGEMRKLLAYVCVDALKPDLIIVDEFQRFKELLNPLSDEEMAAAEIAQAFFNSRSPAGEASRVLLLSATPYKLFTTDAEIEQEDHYRDFIDTTAFLLGNNNGRMSALKSAIIEYGRALQLAVRGDRKRVLPAKSELERLLRKVMARTERVAVTAEQDGMLVEFPAHVTVRPEDIEQYLVADSVFQAVKAGDAMTYWKAAPYLPNFMHRYKLNELIQQAIENRDSALLLAMGKHQEKLLSYDKVSSLEPVPFSHAKLRDLEVNLLDSGLWKLLWMPPSVPYWSLSGAYAGQADMTKSLLFSAWNMVPDVVSGLLSYEAERRMLGEGFSSYHEPDRQQGALLRLTESGGARNRHRLLLFMMPCLTLADEAHPLTAPQGVDRREWVRQRVAILLETLPNPTSVPVDRRWEWAVPVLLDPQIKDFLQQWSDGEVAAEAQPNAEYLPAYISDILSLDLGELGARPANLLDIVTDVALGSPAVLAARMLASAGLPPILRRELSVNVSYAFWRLFNRPAVTRLIRQLDLSAAAEHEDDAYWHRILRYCIDGNLQAVLDECWHLVHEQNGWSEAEGDAQTYKQCINELVGMIEPRSSRALARCYRVDKDSVESKDVHFRMMFALRLGQQQSEEGALNQDAVRAAFNGPFRPFLLSSTSVGQEGLDFHPWCHRIIHWNLPGNPVDMEQREGRVHRYKGHAVRKNVSAMYADQALRLWRLGDDLWKIIFDLADKEARSQGLSELVPYWVAEGTSKIQRHVPALPYSSEVKAFSCLKRQLAAYRVVFGQPRQEELLELLASSDISRQQMQEWSINLLP